jgi:hypothetical protein
MVINRPQTRTRVPVDKVRRVNILLGMRGSNVHLGFP